MKKMVAMGLVVMMSVLFGGCGGQKETANQAKMQELVIGTMPDVDSIPFIIAQEKGYFKEEGVTVNLKAFKSAMDRDSALQSGNLDGAISDMLAVAFAKSGGFDVKMTSLTCGSYKLIAGRGENAAAVRDLKDKEVAVSKNTIIEYVTDRITEKNSMAADAIRKVVIPQIPTRLEMLQSGKLAAATLPEPMASIAASSGGKLLSSSDQLGIRPGVMMFTAKAAAGKQAELKAMYRAYNKAVAYLAKEPKEAYMDLLIEKGGFPPSVRDVLVLPQYKKASLPDEKDVAACMEWMTDKKLIDKPYAYQELVDGSFLEP